MEVRPNDHAEILSLFSLLHALTHVTRYILAEQIRPGSSKGLVRVLRLSITLRLRLVKSEHSSPKDYKSSSICPTARRYNTVGQTLIGCDPRPGARLESNTPRAGGTMTGRPAHAGSTLLTHAPKALARRLRPT